MSWGEYIPTSNTKILLRLNGNTADYSGNSIPCAATSIIWGRTYGKFNSGAQLRNASSTSCGLAVSNNVILNPGFGNITISIWFKTVDTRTTSAKYVVCKYNNAVQNNLFFIYILTNYTLAGYFRDTNGNAVTISGGPAVNDGNWHHAMWVRNGTTGNLYLDGNLIGTNTNAALGNVNVNNAAAHLWLGVFSNSLSITSFPVQYHFDGSLDEFFIENIAWNSNMVKKYFTMCKGRFGV